MDLGQVASKQTTNPTIARPLSESPNCCAMTLPLLLLLVSLARHNSDKHHFNVFSMKRCGPDTKMAFLELWAFYSFFALSLKTKFNVFIIVILLL